MNEGFDIVGRYGDDLDAARAFCMDTRQLRDPAGQGWKLIQARKA
ncbi:hypothetical protein [Bordetella sp. FB-8]|nr:hypothetical protein [Bordetella sp. FB-8]